MMAPRGKLNVQELDAETFDALAKDDNDPSLTVDELIARFALIHNISKEEASEIIGAETPEEVLNKIADFTTQRIKQTEIKLNRAQRRALQKKYGKNAVFQSTIKEQQDAINDAARKLNYIDLIQKLRALNEKKAKEQENDGETTD